MKKAILSILLALTSFQYGCRSYTFSKTGKVESSFSNYYYFNNRLKVGSVLFGDMPMKTDKSRHGTSVDALYPSDKKVLKKFKFNKLDTILFSSRPTIDPYYNIIGSIRDLSYLKMSHYQMFLEGKAKYLRRKINYRNREAFEGLIPLENNKFLSLIYYLPSKEDENTTDFNSLMAINSQRIKAGQALLYESEPFDDAEALFDNHGYFAASKLDMNRNRYREGMLNQVLATYYSFCGDLDLANHSWESIDADQKEQIKKKNLTSAKARIVDMAANKQVVMFNTAHHRPEHAYFVGKLLDELYKKGFTYLALESLFDAKPFRKRGFVTFADGFYVRDPVMSNLINYARSIGFDVISYDTDDENREEKQATNIISQTFTKNKYSKIVVLAGYDHIKEVSKPKRMAAYFKEVTGLDPLTIDQTTLMSSSCNDIDKREKEEVFVYSEKKLHTDIDLVLWNNINMNDKPVGFPAYASTKNIKLDIPKLSLQVNKSAVLMIYDYKNYIVDTAAVPIYVKILNNDNLDLRLKMGKGKYIIKYLGENKELLYKNEFDIQ